MPLNLFKNPIAIGLLLLIVGGLFLVARSPVNDKARQEEVRIEEKPLLQKAPDFSLKDYNGQIVKLSDFLGKPVIVNSWAAWCPFCVEELPDFAKIQEEFAGGVVIIAVDRAESLKTAKEFSDKYGTTGKIILLLDPSDSFYQSIGGFSMPETIFVDKDGNIVFHKRGPMKLDEIKRRTKEVFGI